MDLSLNDEQHAVRSAFADFFKQASTERVRAAEPGGFDDELWSSLLTTGAHVMGVREDRGGGGAGSMEMALVCQEYGRSIAPIPLVEAMAAADVLARTDRGADLLAEVVEGDLLPTVAVRPATDGTATLVPAGSVADLVIGLAGDRLLAVVRRGSRPHAEPVDNLGSLPLADVLLTSDAVVLATGDEARALHAAAVSQWKLLTAAALDGLRAAALDIGVAYVKERSVFGKPVGWFQAVQHRLADVTAAGDGAELLVHEAAWARDSGQDRADELASMAFLFTADTAFRTCRESLQFHGGYGYTLEYDIQLYFRRAKSWPLVIGPLGPLYQQLAGAISVPDPTAGA